MKLRYVRKVRWTILAVCDERGGCQLLDFLGDSACPTGKAARNMLALIARTAEHGLSGNRELSRDLGDDIYELRKSGLRVLFFYDAGRVIICSHAYPKQSQKIGHGQKERACRARKLYFEAKHNGELEILDS